MGIASMRHLLVHTITRKPYTGKDSFGDPTYGAAETYRARIEGHSRLIRRPDGKELESHRQVFVDTGQGAAAVVFDVKDRLELPVPFWPADQAPPAILDVIPQVGPSGIDHLEVWL